MKTEQVAIAAIQIGLRLRPLDEASVAAIVGSLKELGLQSPIAVRYPAEADSGHGTVARGEPVLVVGHHRLAAAKLLGWTHIDAVVLDGDERDARLWEISENLHRAELTVQERAEHIAEWVKLISDKLSETPSAKGGRPGAAAAASRELGLGERDVQRALKIAGLSDDAKAMAVEAKLDDNQSALLKAAKATDPKAELRRLRAAKDVASTKVRDREADRDHELTAADEFGNWLLKQSTKGQLPTLITWVECSKPADVVAVLRRISP